MINYLPNGIDIKESTLNTVQDNVNSNMYSNQYSF